ncbi:MAG: ferrous iron transport protein A [Dehalococcoidia bacterium]|nr:ferrous iron transport protein A [Dehalococcoidia bacterium]
MTSRSEGPMTLAEMRTGQTGTVVEILGGHGFVRRLETLGIRPGKRLTKVSSTLFHGPVTFKVDKAQVAVGFGVARGIIVQVDRYLPPGP